MAVEGVFEKDRIPVERDVYYIVERLKAQDPRLFVMYNTKAGKYEIHDSATFPDTLSLTLQFDALDARALRYARAHRIERMEEIVAQMDAHNEALRRQGVQKVMDENEGRLREIADYARRSVTQEYVPGDAFTTRFV